MEILLCVCWAPSLTCSLCPVPEVRLADGPAPTAKGARTDIGFIVFSGDSVCATAGTAVGVTSPPAPTAAPSNAADSVAAGQFPGWKQPLPLTVTAVPVIKSGTSVATPAAAYAQPSKGTMVGP